MLFRTVRRVDQPSSACGRSPVRLDPARATLGGLSRSPRVGNGPRNQHSREHTANVHDSLREFRRLVEGLVEKRDERREGFVSAIRKATGTKLGNDTDEVLKVLSKHSFTGRLAKEALEVVRKRRLV